VTKFLSNSHVKKDSEFAETSGMEENVHPRRASSVRLLYKARSCKFLAQGACMGAVEAY